MLSDTFVSFYEPKSQKFSRKFSKIAKNGLKWPFLAYFLTYVEYSRGAEYSTYPQKIFRKRFGGQDTQKNF